MALSSNPRGLASGLKRSICFFWCPSSSSLYVIFLTVMVGSALLMNVWSPAVELANSQSNRPLPGRGMEAEGVWLNVSGRSKPENSVAMMERRLESSPVGSGSGSNITGDADGAILTTEPSVPNWRLFEDGIIPYYLMGRYRFLRDGSTPEGETRRELIHRIAKDVVEPVAFPLAATLRTINGSFPSPPNTWVLPHTIDHPTRNHDSVIVEGVDPHTGKDRLVVYSILGRYSRYVQSLDLITGEMKAKRTKGKVDPAGKPLDDLNHVAAILIDSIDAAGNNTGKKEIWLPCGFHGDKVNSEFSSDYVRIIDIDTMKIRSGPRLPHSGGACVATSLAIIPSEPPMICAFAGTQGTHDAGIFLPHTQCYDRIRERWWDPFGPLPYGLDHGSLAPIPPGTCSPDDPAKLLIFNFRTRPYGDCHPEILAYDLPGEGWTIKELERLDGLKQLGERTPEKSEWYVYHNFTDLTSPENEPRDASGVVMANGGRTVLNFGGTTHRIKHGKRRKVRFSMIRALDVCAKQWKIIGDLGLSTFALQSSGSAIGNVAITCGGEAPLFNANSPICFAGRWEGLTVDDQHTPIAFKKV